MGSASLNRRTCFTVSSSWNHRRCWVTHWHILSCKTRIYRVIQLASIKAGRNWHYMTKALAVNTWDIIHDFKVVYCPSNNVKWKKKNVLTGTSVHMSTGLCVSGEEKWLLKPYLRWLRPWQTIASLSYLNFFSLPTKSDICLGSYSELLKGPSTSPGATFCLVLSICIC